MVLYLNAHIYNDNKGKLCRVEHIGGMHWEDRWTLVLQNEIRAEKQAKSGGQVSFPITT